GLLALRGWPIFRRRELRDADGARGYMTGFSAGTQVAANDRFAIVALSKRPIVFGRNLRHRREEVASGKVFLVVGLCPDGERQIAAGAAALQGRRPGVGHGLIEEMIDRN